LWQRLQGAVAFVAGIGRILVAVYGSGDLVCAMAWVGIAHSLFEIWLLPRSLSQVRTVAGLVFAVHAGDVQSQGGLRGQPCKVAKLKPCKVVNKYPNGYTIMLFRSVLVARPAAAGAGAPSAQPGAPLCGA
jgi:hypothetical protein